MMRVTGVGDAHSTTTKMYISGRGVEGELLLSLPQKVFSFLSFLFSQLLSLGFPHLLRSGNMAQKAVMVRFFVFYVIKVLLV